MPVFRNIKLLKLYLGLNFKAQMEFRINFIFSYLSGIFLPLTIDIFLWIAIYSYNNRLQYSLKEMIIYVVLSHFLFAFGASSIESTMEVDIKNGSIVPKLLWPCQYLENLIVSELGAKLMNLSFYFILFFIIAVVSFFYPLASIHVSFKIIVLFIFSVLLNLMISILIGLCSFYFTEIWGISAIKNLSFSLLTGTVFPLDILPEMGQTLLSFTPFPYMVYLPNILMLGYVKTSNIFIERAFMIAPIYLLLFAIMIKIMWNFGIKRYQTIGG